MIKKLFKDCVNVNSPEFKALAASVGRNEAELLTRLNNMAIPNKGQAEAMQVKYRNQSYKDLIHYLDTAPFVDEIGIRKRLTHVISSFNGSNYIVTTRNETVKNVFSGPNQYKSGQAIFNKEVYLKNIKTIEDWNLRLDKEGYPRLFKITQNPNGRRATVSFDKKAIDYYNAKRSEYIDYLIEFDRELEESKETEDLKNPIRKLERVENEPAREAKFLVDIKKWLFSDKIDFQDQLNTINTLSGKVYNQINRAITVQNKVKAGDVPKPIRIFTVDRDGKDGQLEIKIPYQDKLAELKAKKELTAEEDDLMRKLEVVLSDEVWSKFQDAVVENLKTLGYKLTKKPGMIVGEAGGLKVDQENQSDKNTEQSLPQDTDPKEQVEGEAGMIGKGSSYSDLASIMLKVKENMSSHLRIWLAGIPSTTRSFIPINSLGGVEVKSTNSYVDVDDVIITILESVVGKTTPAAMIAALRENSSRLPNREHLSIVADKLEKAFEEGEAIANEFYTRFNLTRNEMVMVKYELTPRKIEVGGESTVLKDENGDIIYDLNNKVINVNRNDVPKVIVNNWYTTFSIMFNLNNADSFEADSTTLKDIELAYNEYTNFKNSILQYFDKDGNLVDENNRIEVRSRIKNLFANIGITLNDPVIDTLIDSENRVNRFSSIKNISVFNSNKGYFATIFENLNPNKFSPEDAFNSTGMQTLAKRMSAYTDAYLTMSSTDEKGRTITAYGLHDHFTKSFWDLVNYAVDLKSQRDRIANGEDIEESSPLLHILNNRDFKSSSKNLKRLAYLQAENLNIFLNNFEYTIFNVTKSAIRGTNAKELPDMNPREFLNTKIMLFTNSAFDKWEDLNRTRPKWSFKFLTTPEAKTKMYAIKTPDHNVNINIDGDKTQVLNRTVEAFFDYFLGEYKSIKSYLDAAPEIKEEYDAITTYEPKIFYSFGQFNLKSSLLWEVGADGNFKLKDILDPEVAAFVKMQIQEQVEQDIERTYKDWEILGLIKDDKYIGGFNSNYVNKLPSAISLKESIQGKLDRIKVLETAVLKGELPSEVYQEQKNQLLEAHKQLSAEADKRITQYLVADFAINMQLHNMEMNTLFLGDPRGKLKDAKSKITMDQFNGKVVLDKAGVPVAWNEIGPWARYLSAIRENANKRYAGVQGSGQQSLHQDKPNVGYVVIQDFKVPSKIIDQIRDFDSDLADRFTAIPTLDGQEIKMPEEDLTNRRDAGKISQDQYIKFLEKLQRGHEDIEKQGFVSDENMFTPDELTAQPEKPVYFGEIPNDELRMDVELYVKPSSFALYPQFTQNTELDKLRKFAYTHNKSGKTRIDRFPVVSATKLGASNVVTNVFRPDMTIDENALSQINDQNIIIAPRSNLRTQLEVPYDTSHTSIRVSTQQVKKVFSEVLDVVFDAAPIGKGKLTGEELKTLHNEIYENTFDIHLTGLLVETGAVYDESTGEYSYTSLEKLQKKLYRHASENGYPLNELEGLLLTGDKEEFVIPLAFSGNLKGYQSMLLSLIGDVIFQKIHGRSFIMATEQGFKPTKKDAVTALSGDKAKEWINYNTTNMIWVKKGYDPSVGLLPQRPDPNNAEKLLPGQAAITWNFQDKDGNVIDINEFIVEEDGHKFLDLDKIDPELLKMIGNRIPIHGHPSMADLEVVAFVPVIMGDMIISSQDLTTIMGADFDIDKLYAYIYNYYYGYEEDIREELKDNYEEIREKLVKLKDPRLDNFKDKMEFIKDVRNRIKSRYNNEEGSIFRGYILNSIDKKQKQLSAKYRYKVSNNAVIEFFESLSPEEIYDINLATYVSKREGAPTLENMYQGKELRLAKAVKNHIGFYNSMFREAIKADKELADEYTVYVLEKMGMDKEVKALRSEQSKLKDTPKKLFKIKPNYENIEENSIKQLHNALQDIYHIILSDKKLWKKILEGVNEGKLAEVSSTLKTLRPTPDTFLPSMSSDRYKNQEYFANRASRLGVGIFSVGNTFFTLIEGAGLYLSKYNSDYGKPGQSKLLNDPFILKDSAGNTYEFLDISGHKGYDRLISIFQSISLDDVKLQILKAINENRLTMGATVILASIANDSIGSKGEPLLSEEYLGYYIAQPVITEFVEKMGSGNDSLDFKKDNEFKDKIIAELTEKYNIEEEDPALNGKPYLGYSLEELKAAVYHEKEFNETGEIKDAADGFTAIKYKKMQGDILEMFLKMADRGEVVRNLQYLVNSDSKGTPSSVQEAIFKKDSFDHLMNNLPTEIGNVENIFFDKDGSPNLTHYFFDLGVKLPIQLFKGTEQTGPILPFSSYKYSTFIKELAVLQHNRGEDFYNSLKYERIWNSYLSYMLSDPLLSIANESMLMERFKLIYDTDTNKSLGTEIDEYKTSMQYINNPALRPLFASVEISIDKNAPSTKFVNFNASVGLTVNKDEISIALFFLRKLNYPLFEKLIKYSLVVSPPNAPTSIRKYIPNIYLSAIGVTDKMRFLNRRLNVSAPDRNIAISPYLPPVRPLHQQLFQHYPELAFKFDTSEVEFSSGGNTFFISQKENSRFYKLWELEQENPDGTSNRVVSGDGYTAKVFVPVQYASTYNPSSRSFELYKLVEFSPNQESVYARIPLQGAYNLSEFDAGYYEADAKFSLIPTNNVQFKYTPTNAYTIIDANLATSMEDMLGHSGAAYGGDSLFHIGGKEFGVKFIHYRGDDWMSKSLKNALTKEEQKESLRILKPEELEVGYKALEIIYRRTFERSKENDLKARNYFQVANQPAVYAVAPIINAVRVSGGTNTAIEMAKMLKKPIFVLDTKTIKWYKWNGSRFELTETPYLTKNFAGIGSRDLELYKIPIKDDKGNVIDFTDNADKYVGDAAQKAIIQAIREVYIKTSRVLNGDLPTESAKNAEVPTTATVVTFTSPSSRNENHLTTRYGYDPQKSGKENVISILKTISRESTNDSYRILADIFLSVADNQQALDDVQLELGNVNEYDNGVIRLKVNTEDKDVFESTFQYNFLHEASHHYIIERLDDGSEMATVLSNNIERMIETLARPENLAKAIKMFKLNTTPEKLLEKLKLLRAESGVSATDGGTTGFSSEAERSILNALINKYEFTASLLNDEGTQKWANNVEYESQNIFKRFGELIQSLFDNFLRSLGIKISSKANTVLKNGINTIMQILSKKAGKTSSKLEDLQPNHTVFIEQNGFDVGKTGLSPLRWMPEGAKFRPDVKGKTMIDAIISLDRTSTTVALTRRQNIEKKVGGVTKDGIPKGNPYLWVRDTNGNDAREVLIKVNKIHQVSNGKRGMTPEQWSRQQGWDVSYASLKPEVIDNRHFDIDFEYVNPESLVAKPTPPSTGTGEQLNLFGSLKPLLKLPDVNIEDSDLTPEQIAEKEIILRLVDKYRQRRNDLWNAKNNIYKDKDLSPEQKEEKLEDIQDRINIINANEENLIANLNGELFHNIATKELNYAEAVLAKENVTVGEVLESVQIVITYKDIYNDIINDLAKETSKVEGVDPTLLAALRRGHKKATGLLTPLRAASEKYIVSKYKDIYGEEMTPEELFRQMDRSTELRSMLLPAVDSMNILNRFLGRLIHDSSVSRDMGTFHFTQKIEKLHKKAKEAGFDSKEHVIEYDYEDPITGLPGKKLDWITRYNPDAYAKMKADIYKNAPENKKKKREYFRKAFHEVSYDVDLRYLFPEEYNLETNEELRIATEGDQLSAKDIYLAVLRQYYREEYSQQYGETYTMYRLNEILRQAIEKGEAYIEDKQEAFKLIEDNEPDMAIAFTKKQDWLARNSPFFLLDEQYALRPNASTQFDLLPAHSKYPPKISELDSEGNQKTVPWTVVDPITGKFIPNRLGKKYITKKYRNKRADGSLTGLINEKYSNWEKEYSEIAYPVEQKNLLDRLAGIEPKEEVPFTQFGFLRERMDNQKMFVKMFPYHLTKDLKWYNYLDIGRSLDEKLGELSIFYKFSVYPGLIWDNAVSAISIPYYEKGIQKLDLVTQEVRKNYDPSILGNTMNTQGIGDFKTKDAIYYDLTIMKAAIEFQTKADIENSIKILQYLQKYGELTNPGQVDKEGEMGKGTPYSSSPDKEVFDWTINKMLYNEGENMFFSQTESDKFRAGSISLSELHNSKTKLLGILPSKLKLTSVEREKLNRLEKRKSQIANFIRDAQNQGKPLSEEKVDALRDELIRINEAIERIVRVSTPRMKYKMFHAFLRTKFMGYNVYGRIMDTTSTGILGNAVEAADGRLFGYKDLAQSWALCLKHYALPYASAGLLTYSALNYGIESALRLVNPESLLATIGSSLTPGATADLVGLGVAAGAGALVVNKIIWVKEKMKMDQLMQLFGQFNTFETFNNEQIQQLAAKKISILAPMGLASMGELFNKATTFFSVLFAQKVTDLEGKKRPLYDAYVIGDNGFIRWNEEEFGPASDKGMSLYEGNTKKMLEVRRIAERAIAKVSGDYSKHAEKLFKKGSSILYTELLFLRQFIGQYLYQRWGDEWKDGVLNMKQTGYYKAPYKTVKKYFKGEEIPEHYWAANRKALVGGAVILGGLYMLSYMLKSVWERDKATAVDDSVAIALNLANRAWANETQALDPGVFKAKSISGVSPTLTTMYQVMDVFAAYRKASKMPKSWPFWKRDALDNTELKALKLMPKNEFIDTEYSDSYSDFYEEMVEDSTNKYMEISTGLETTSQYQTLPYVGESMSRMGYKALKIFPFTSTYVSNRNAARVNNMLNK